MFLASNLSDGVLAFGTFLVGIGTLGAMALSARNGARLNVVNSHALDAKTKAEEAALKAEALANTSDRIEKSVGETNGQSIAEMMKVHSQLQELFQQFERYQHDRNHELLNRMTLLTLGLPQLVVQVERQTETLREILHQVTAARYATGDLPDRRTRREPVPPETDPPRTTDS